MPPTGMAVRARRPEDLAQLWRLLVDQQPLSRYPVRPVHTLNRNTFLHTEDATAAWTAVEDDLPVGHICHVSARHDSPEMGQLYRVCAQAHGCRVEQLAWISTFVVDASRRGGGIGQALLRTAVADIRERGGLPCLEVHPWHPAAIGLYRAQGWHQVAEVRPPWLIEVMGDEGPDVVVMVLQQEPTHLTLPT